MICPRCNRWAPACPETGYDVNEPCPQCTRKERDDWPHCQRHRVHYARCEDCCREARQKGKDA